MMRTTILFSLCLVSISVFAEEPAQRGQILILRNERTLSGDITRVGNQYEIRRSLGRSWIPVEKTLALCRNLEEAYQVLRGRANVGDADERLRLARWCYVQKLYPQALIEIKAAVRLRPDHAESQRLLRYFEMTAKHAAKEVSPGKPPKPTKTVAKKKPELPPPAVTLTAHAMETFTRQVQPLLMNACIRCHSKEKSEKFRLTPVYRQTLLSPTTTQHNLVAVLSQIDGELPEQSPLLLNAIRAHGKSGIAPLSRRQLPAYATLQRWVHTTLASNPHLRGLTKKPAKTVLNELPPLPPPMKEEKRDWKELKAVQSKVSQGFGTGREQEPEPKPSEITTPRKVTTTPSLEKPKTSLDQYDPAIFNELMHPERFKKEKSASDAEEKSARKTKK